MPQIKFSGLVTAMKGKAGGSIFSQNKQGAYFRNNRWGGGRKSGRWDAAKQRLTILSNAWRNLSAEQREAWESAGVNFPFQNKFKDEYIPNGYQLFMSLNGNLYAQGLPTLSVPGEKRPFPEDIQITGGTPDVPWVTGGIVTGKPIVLGGSLGRTSATGDGVAISIREALKLKNIDPSKATVAIQGFGKVGYWAAVALEKQGLKVTAVSDVFGIVTGKHWETLS